MLATRATIVYTAFYIADYLALSQDFLDATVHLVFFLAVVKILTAKTNRDHLYTAGMPDPDLLVRTAGELRVSNYLLWQISYAELFVSDVLWPDFGVDDLHAAIRAFASRNRRFGALDHTNTLRR